MVFANTGHGEERMVVPQTESEGKGGIVENVTGSFPKRSCLNCAQLRSHAVTQSQLHMGIDTFVSSYYLTEVPSPEARLSTC